MLKCVQLVFLTGLVLSSQLADQIWADRTAVQKYASSLVAFDSDAGDPKDESCDFENISFTFTPKVPISLFLTQTPILPSGEPKNAKSNPHPARAPPRLI